MIQAVYCLVTEQAITNGDLRLVGGSHYWTGRVEIFISSNNTWGTICDDDWDDQDAQVACKQLGLSDTGTAISEFSPSASPSVPIWLDNVNCNGHETRLIYCGHNGLGNHDCNHNKDAGVTCETSEIDMYVRMSPIAYVYYTMYFIRIIVR